MRRRWCSGRRRARPPARSPHASLKARSGRSRSPPVPSGPSGALHTSDAWSLFGASSRSPDRPRHLVRINFACNSPDCISDLVIESLIFCGFWACVDSCAGGIACEICKSEVFLTSVGLRVGGTVAGRRMSRLRVPQLGSQTVRRPPRQSRAGASECLAPVISHVIPWRLLQTLNSPRCNCNVCGWSPKVTAGNYVRFLSGLSLPRPAGVTSGFSASAFTKMLVAARHTPDREDSTSSDRVESSR